MWKIFNVDSIKYKYCAKRRWIIYSQFQIKNRQGFYKNEWDKKMTLVFDFNRNNNIE